ncbi:DUF7946 domain-containing protein [Acinetobacter baumannii]|uniref:DUF7946 domain-containing protein n=1 Tax=Acinetobacter baumannii TaxID=470 RepID=UPI000DE75738|nr:hypothetical protein [Acinetobacter baumannii]EHU2374531.1 hypothetical protein [Acinetobacter baumannii]EHU2750690.1 hypothetical protein [Acinetobacter baumannii]MDC4674747.1 hypothetical protein [Acinetobacter baumannii]MDC5497748.1 hypothetical protein [Acinetobacter baumannii]MDO7425246.1 hypothetical protein [Acinetobacter baumannii]
MQIPLDLVIETPSTVHQVDMKTGLDTMQGISDSIRTITETIVNKKIPEKKSARNKIRTNMKNTFSGSYGLVFSLDAYDEAKELFNIIGKSVILELIEYYLAEALDTSSKPLSSEAEKIRESLGELSIELISVLRGNMLKDAHKATQNFGYTTKLRYRSNKNIRELQIFDENTYASLVPKENKHIQNLEVAITRFNRFTGNGRLQVKGVNETHAFGFLGYKTIENYLRRKVASNLLENTGINDIQDMSFLGIECYTYERRDGKVIKYMIKKIL